MTDIVVSIDAPEIEINLDNGIIRITPELYTGAYIVTPKIAEETILQTAQKYLENNVRVLEIPVHEVTNPQGGTTVTIGEVNYGSI